MGRGEGSQPSGGRVGVWPRPHSRSGRVIWGLGLMTTGVCVIAGGGGAVAHALALWGAGTPGSHSRWRSPHHPGLSPWATRFQRGGRWAAVCSFLQNPCPVQPMSSRHRLGKAPGSDCPSSSQSGGEGGDHVMWGQGCSVWGPEVLMGGRAGSWEL